MASLFSLFSRRPSGVSEQPSPSLAPPPPPAPVRRAAPLQREEVLDANNRLYGYRFRVASSQRDAALWAALEAERIAEFAVRRLAVIPISTVAAEGPHAPFAAAHTVFLFDAGLLENGLAQDQVQALKRDGARAGVRGLPAPGAQDALLGACDFLFLDLGAMDLRHVHAALEAIRARHPQLKIAMEGVNSWEEQRMCRSWGVDYFMGSFLTQPDVEDHEGSLDQSQLVALELLNLLRSDAELAQLTEVAKRDPAITLQLLKWANAPVNGQAGAITSLGQAIVVLGRSTLYRWLAVSMFKLGKSHERDTALLEVALRRARFLELVNPGLTAAERDELFLVGLLSLFDLLFRAPMARLLQHMNVSDDARAVLLGSAGKYGPYLMLALLTERSDWQRAATIAVGQGIAPASLGEVQAAAFAWAQESLMQ